MLFADKQANPDSIRIDAAGCSNDWLRAVLAFGKPLRSPAYEKANPTSGFATKSNARLHFTT